MVMQKTAEEWLPEVYQQSEQRKVPHGWKVVPLSDVITLQRGYDLPSYARKKGSIPIVSSSGVSDFHNEPMAKGPGVITGRYGTIGEVFYTESDYWPLNTTLYVKSFTGLVPRFAYYLLKTVDFQSHSGKSGVPGVNRNDVHAEIVRVPTKDEQAAIANALSDVDALIAEQEKLIAKKQAIKTATMQQLLTGKTRLPQFAHHPDGSAKGYKASELGEVPEDWAVLPFSDVAAPVSLRINPKVMGGGDFCVELEHISQGGRLTGFTETRSESSLKSIFELGDVLFGKLRSYLRKYWIANRSGVCSTEIWVLRSKPKQSIPDFVFYLVQTDSFIDAASEAYGTHMPRADWNVIREHAVTVPCTEEQSAIATILTDMDSEIEALQKHLSKTRQIKQGMMQELLTGKTRLPFNDNEAAG